MRNPNKLAAGAALALAVSLGTTACGHGAEANSTGQDTAYPYIVQNPGHDMNPELWTVGEKAWELQAIHFTGCQTDSQTAKPLLTEYQREVYPLVSIAINVESKQDRSMILGQYHMDKAPDSVQAFLDETC